jgi:CRP-like cAMP-binding protein
VPAGQAFAVAGEAVDLGFFPESGAFCWVSDMTTGHQVAVALVGRDGLVGVSKLIGLPRHSYRIVSLFDVAGYRVSGETVRRAFNDSEIFRTQVLSYVGRQLVEISSFVACNRIHSHRRRLARWLLMMADKSGSSSLNITHDVLAQVVGGPRHAVTVALNKLRTGGAVAHLRGRIEILDRQQLIGFACECYVSPQPINASQLH